MRHKILYVFAGLAVVAAFFPASFAAAAPVAGIAVSPDTGVCGTNISITGAGFTPETAGILWLDINGNGAKDEGEPSRAVSSTAAGEIPRFTRLAAPAAPAGTYKIDCDIPAGGAIEAAANFTIVPGLSLSLKTGYSGMAVTVAGSGFGAGAAGRIWFDTNNDGRCDAGEPQAAVTAGASGAVPDGISLTTPATPPGTYRILADMPDGGAVEASADFTYTSTLVLSPSPVTSNLGAVIMDTVITIGVTGGGFVPGAAGYVWFDYNKNDIRDADEPQAPVTVDAGGLLPAGISLKTPKLPPCTNFDVDADLPGDGTIDARAVLAVAETTTSVTIRKHDPYGNIVASKTVTWEWMKDNLPVIGDGKTDYYIQKGTAVSDTFEAAWDPQETNTDSLLEMGCARGTDVKDLLELAGGASKGDSILFTASDNWQTWFDYENIYDPAPRQGKVVLAWWNSLSGGYVPEFYLGMRLYCFAETANAAGQHIFGDWDMHETMAPSRWEFSPIGGASSRLSNKYVRYIDIYEPNLYPCDAGGEVCNYFAAGETVYVKGLGLNANTDYKLWIQPDGVQVSPLGDLDLRSGEYVLDGAKDPSGAPETVTTDAKGDFSATGIWTVPAGSVSPVKYDVVADKQSGDKVGIYDTGDAVANPGWEGFNAPAENPAPGSHLSTADIVTRIISGVLLLVAVILGVMLIISLRRQRPRGK